MHDSSHGNAVDVIESASTLGPVLPAPPRFLSIKISGSFEPEKYLMAEYKYTGGLEGASEFWWMRISRGERQVLGEPTPLKGEHLDCNSDDLAKKIKIVENKGDFSAEEVQDAKNFLHGDPRVYKLSQGDVGCLFKVKCRPVRNDGYKGEIFTSKPSREIQMM